MYLKKIEIKKKIEIEIEIEIDIEMQMQMQNHFIIVFNIFWNYCVLWGLFVSSSVFLYLYTFLGTQTKPIGAKKGTKFILNLINIEGEVYTNYFLRQKNSKTRTLIFSTTIFRSRRN